MKQIVLELNENEEKIFQQMINQAMMQYDMCPEIFDGDDGSFEDDVTTLFKKLKKA